MKRWQMRMALALAGGALAGNSVRQPVAAPAKVAPAWLSDYQTAQTAARQTAKPIFLVFR